MITGVILMKCEGVAAMVCWFDWLVDWMHTCVSN